MRQQQEGDHGGDPGGDRGPGQRQRDWRGAVPGQRADQIDHHSGDRGPSEGEPDEAGGSGDAEEGDRQDHQQGGARVHPEQPGIGEWVPGDALHHRSSCGQAGAHQHPEQGARQPLVDHHVLTVVAHLVVDQCLPHSAGLDLPGADRQAGEYGQQQQDDADHHGEPAASGIARGAHRSQQRPGEIRGGGLGVG